MEQFHQSFHLRSCIFKAFIVSLCRYVDQKSHTTIFKCVITQKFIDVSTLRQQFFNVPVQCFFIEYLSVRCDRSQIDQYILIPLQPMLAICARRERFTHQRCNLVSHLQHLTVQQIHIAVREHVLHPVAEYILADIAKHISGRDKVNQCFLHILIGFIYSFLTNLFNVVHQVLHCLDSLFGTVDILELQFHLSKRTFLEEVLTAHHDPLQIINDLSGAGAFQVLKRSQQRLRVIDHGHDLRMRGSKIQQIVEINLLAILDRLDHLVHLFHFAGGILDCFYVLFQRFGSAFRSFTNIQHTVSSRIQFRNDIASDKRINIFQNISDRLPCVFRPFACFFEALIRHHPVND